jgi:hypothetical protein
MIVRCIRETVRFPSRNAAAVVLVIIFALSRPVAAQPAPAEPRVLIGKTVSEPGTLLTREADDQPWKHTGDVFSRDRLLALGGLKSIIQPASETVRLTLWGNLPTQSSLPMLESTAILHDTRAFDLDLTLLGGRALITSTKKTGPAKVWLRMPGEGWEITLDGPGATVALELYGRWPRGVPFSKDPLASEWPISVLSFLVLQGNAEVRFDGRQQRLAAPPGPAFLHWDSLVGADLGPQRIEKLPDWATRSGAADQSKTAAEVGAKYLELLQEKSAILALQSLLGSAEADTDATRANLTREFSVLGLAAIGALPQLAELLATSQSADVRETVILAMRHWIGSTPGRDLQLHSMLVNYFKYPERQADTVLQLLHSPFDARDPVTYQTLIAYLQHDKLAIRALARWHLYRLVPAGANIAYDPNAGAEARAKAAQDWKQLIPDGELPKKPETPK